MKFGNEVGAVEIAVKYINRQQVVFLIAVADFVTVMWKYSLTVIGAAEIVAANTYPLALFCYTPVSRVICNLPLGVSGMKKLMQLQ